MNILALNWQDLKNPLSGGAEVHLEENLRRIVKAGHRVTLFCSNYKDGKTEDEVEGVRIIRAGNRYNFNWIAPFHLRRLVRREKFDLFLEDINKIPFYTPFYLKLPTVVIIPHLFSTTVYHEIDPILGTYIYLAELPMTKIYRRKQFVVISESTRDDMIKRGVPPENITVIHCGIDRELYNNNKSYGKFDYPAILYLGRIKKYKSVQHLVMAFKMIRDRISNARLAIVGAGDYSDKLKTLANKLGVADSTEFPGFVPRDRKVEYMCRSHVMVYPSLKEGWGLTNIEANSCGTAVIAARTAGLRDSVKDGVSGWLYDYGNIDELADKLYRILTDKEKRKELERGGLEWSARFDWNAAASKFLELCEKVARV